MTEDEKKSTPDEERRRALAESNARIDAARACVAAARRKFFEARDQLYALNGHARR